MDAFVQFNSTRAKLLLLIIYCRFVHLDEDGISIHIPVSVDSLGPKSTNITRDLFLARSLLVVLFLIIRLRTLI